MTAPPNITFIICTYNRADYLDDTLHSLLHQGIGEHRVEILVIDNNSTDDTYSVFEKHRNSKRSSSFILSYCKEEKQGLSHARNRGIEVAKSDNIVFVDDDVLVEQKYVQNWINFFHNYPEYNAAGGKIIVQFDVEKPNWVSHFLLPLFGRHNFGDSIKTYPANKYPFGGNMGFRKTIFREVGVFDTELGRKGKKLTANEEKDLFNRVKEKGETILYLPGATLYHRIGAERLKLSYVQKQANGLGKSIATEVRGSAKKTFKHFLNELFKTFVSLGLLIIYTLELKPIKGITLLKFRYWILQGYLNYSSKKIINDHA